jgi:thioredoxin reductase
MFASFHCLFTFGYEHRGASSIGVLAIGLAGNPMHANILVDDARKFSENVTVYTNGDRTLAQLIKAASVESNTVFDERKISRLVKGNRNVIIEFETGETSEEAVLIHQPFTEVNPTIVEQLNLKLNERGDIVTRMPFYHTNTPGVFAAGDCASPFKIIANAVLMGANAGAGIARELPVRVTGNRVKRLPL